jgi:hypothetical protein
MLRIHKTCYQLAVELFDILPQLHDGRHNENISPENGKRIQHWLNIFSGTAAEWELDHVASSITRLARKIEMGECTYLDLHHGFQSIRDGINDGLSNHLVYRYPREKSRVLEGWQESWRDAIGKFPSCREDVRAGVDLWALGHNTASVFHMMRVLEVGLKAVCLDVGIAYSSEVWNVILNNIEAAVKKEQNVKKHPSKLERLQFLSSCERIPVL